MTGRGRRGWVSSALVLIACTSASAADPPQRAADDGLRGRLQAAVEWLAAPEREGRGPGTAGIDAAADWVAARFADIGLETRVAGDGPFQTFAMTLEAKLGPQAENTAELVAPAAQGSSPRVVPLKLGVDFTPLAAGGSAAFDLPLALAGYGITAPAEHYDDYAPLGAAAKGAALLVLRQEPQKDDPHSVFDGNQASQYAALSRKVANAAEHEAGGLVFVNDSDAEGDTLMAFTRAGEGSGARSMPILQVTRSLLDTMVREALGRSLTEIQQGID